LVEQFVPERLGSLSLTKSTLDVLPSERHEVSRYRVDELLHRLGFSDAQAELPVAALSGGQQNLALLAHAILSEPELLLMDEPGNHMDILALAQLQQQLEAQLISANATLLVTADINAQRCCVGRSKCHGCATGNHRKCIFDERRPDTRAYRRAGTLAGS